MHDSGGPHPSTGWKLVTSDMRWAAPGGPWVNVTLDTGGPHWVCMNIAL